ncbi:DUF2845 domain-containing protein [Dyella silvatica]|uniref:DUF2845 domain-containing protein n=1 Tax=Dyella silvatica TaxID=2992128 RepID=UPI002259F79B|nr:DUF2845 domain-containing protein [Dyella silvatica]
MTLLLLLSGTVHAASTLRVGSQVLVVGDSAARVIELLGRPAYQSASQSSASQSTHGASKKTSRKAASKPSRRGASRSHSRSRGRGGDGQRSRGEQWQYRRDGRSIIVTIVDGKVSDIHTGSG